MKTKANKDQNSPVSSFKMIMILIVSGLLIAAVGTTIDDFFLPGSQPGQSGNLEHPDKCDNCHGGYDQTVEPAFNWRGSMMAQAQRDPLYHACLAIANQDAPESGDLCIRCHAPDGWLNGRSEPTDGAALNNNDYEGVQCDFCHKLVRPTPLDVNPYLGDDYYTNNTYAADQDYLSILSDIPLTSANGMYIASDENAKRGPYSDAEARHQQYYSPFHSESAICGTCHDVSNPAFTKVDDPSATDEFGSPVYAPNSFGTKAPSFDPKDLFPIERTYSEWLVSDFADPAVGGIKIDGFGGNKEFVSTCQDCHMRDVSGFGCNKKGAPFRDDLPLHDMTGGNTFVPGLVAQLYPGDVDQAAIDAGILRATEMLQKAASMKLTYLGDPATGLDVNVKITNNTGHKLPSGYPEGRRIWINLKALNAQGNILFENGTYNFETAELSSETDKIYEIKPGIGNNIAAAVGHPAGVSFHFVLNNQIYKDNRIPPMGATNAELHEIQSPVIAYSYPDGQNWDETTYQVPAGVDKLVATLYYQTLSKEYVTFLRDENVTNDAGQIMYDLWENNGKSAPVVMIQQEIDFSANQETPVAGFSAAPLTGTAPLSVQFTDESTNSPVSHSWDFGDGNTSSQQNPIHTYQNAGIYTVSLTVTNSAGSDNITKTDLIEVQPSSTAGMSVSAISFSPRGTAKGGKEFVEATITLTNSDNPTQPVDGANMTINYTGPTSGSVTGTTDADGKLTIRTRSSKNANEDWCISQISATKSGFTYDGSVILLPYCESSSTSARIANGLIISKEEFSHELMLHQNYPNPFSNQTTLAFNIPYRSNVSLTIFDTQGRIVEKLIEGKLDAGTYQYSLQGGSLIRGHYILKLISGDQVRSKTMIKVD